MDKVKLACTSSDGCESQSKTQVDAPADLQDQIRELLCTTLSDTSIMVMQEKLLNMQRSSYYLVIQQEDLIPTTNDQQSIPPLSKTTLWSLIDLGRLQRTVAVARTQVKVLLSLLGLLFQDIISGSQELEAFAVKYNEALKDSDAAASAQQRLQQVHHHVRDFERRIIWNPMPLNLQNQLMSNTAHSPVPRLPASMVLMRPVIFNRDGSKVTHSSVDLCWHLTGEQFPELDQVFKIEVQRFHPAVNEHCQLAKATCQSYSIQVTNLLSDKYYQFSVKRVDAVNLVYGPWSDTLILKTLDVSK
ncbi:fibronectin type III domain-containing protein 11-like [Odontesthes bonariensis]|uniref:fibronectin type III domain-containing protein 11-like n=1 Tax=Odontesthes bonariensis TaxID=219752 RepID=UPI003F58614E